MVTVVCGGGVFHPWIHLIARAQIGKEKEADEFTAMIEVTFVGCVRAILTDPLTAPSPISQPGGGFLSTTDPIFGALCRCHCRKMCPVGARRCMCVKERAVG